MADEPPFTGELTNDAAALDGALEQARAELDAMRLAASEADAVSDQREGYSVHEVEEIGRYAIAYEDGWTPLLNIVSDEAAGFGFSAGQYPSFDAVLVQHVEQPLPETLCINIAAVRNFLMQSYYADTPAGMTPERAKKALEEIAAYVGDGLSNHYRFEGVIAQRDPHTPLIDPALASETGGAGAQYLYEKILAEDRHANWVRPFSALVALFGGNVASDWMLPPAYDTPFNDWFAEPLAVLDKESTVEEIDAALTQFDQLEAERLALVEGTAGKEAVEDLEVIGNHLVFTAEALRDVNAMSEGVRNDAIEIAKEILRKLRVTIGEKEPQHGLVVSEDEERTTLGGILGVAKLYERLLAWGRGIDPTILQHPSIVAATLALGKMGYLAKLGALRLAQQNGDLAQVGQLEADLNYVPTHYKETDEENFLILLDRIEHGIDTVLNRVQTISVPGASVGHSPAKELGSYMSGTPIAGNALQLNSEGAGRGESNAQQAKIQEGIASANRSQIQRMTQQLASQQHRSAQGVSSAPPARGSTSARLNAIRQRLTQARQSATSLLQNQANLTARTNAQRQANIHGHHDDHHDTHGHPPDPMAAMLAKIDPRLLNNMRAVTNTTGLKPMDISKQKAVFQKMQKAATQGINEAHKAGTKAGVEEHNKQEREHQMLAPPPPPKDKGGHHR